MFRRVAVIVILSAVLSSWLLGCNSQPPVPPAEQFKQVPIGTAMPYEKYSAPVNLPPGMSGAMFINQKSSNIQVAVSDTITTLLPSQAFLFILPPGPYQFYIYQPDASDSVRAETLEPGKVRYVYLLTIMIQ